MRRVADLAIALVAVLTFVLLPQSAQARQIWPAVGARGDTNSRQLVCSYGQKNGQGGSGSSTLSDDGNSLTGEGFQNGKDRFTWSGQPAP